MSQQHTVMYKQRPALGTRGQLVQSLQQHFLITQLPEDKSPSLVTKPGVCGWLTYALL